MSVELPRGAPLGALPLRAWTKRTGEPAAVLRDVLVLRGAYDLVDDGDGPQRMVAVADPVRTAPRLADDGDVLPGGDLPPEDFDLHAEADTAAEKERADLIVLGTLPSDPSAGGSVHVDGEEWLHRAHTLDRGRDRGRNLFGVLGRNEPPRRLDATDSDPATAPLPPGYSALTGNAYRRGGDFSTPDDRNTPPLPSGGLVQVFRTATASDAPVAVRLPDLTLRARLRAWCGHGPDTPPRWAVVDVVEAVPDTLELAPAAGTAAVVWRASWLTDLVPPDRWRAVQVLPGGAATPPGAEGGG